MSAKAVSRLLQTYTFKMHTEKGVLGYITGDNDDKYPYGISEADAFSDWIIKSCLANKQIVLFNDVFISPLCGKNLALKSLELLKFEPPG